MLRLELLRPILIQLLDMKLKPKLHWSLTQKVISFLASGVNVEDHAKIL